MDAKRTTWCIIGLTPCFSETKSSGKGQPRENTIDEESLTDDANPCRLRCRLHTHDTDAHLNHLFDVGLDLFVLIKVRLCLGR